MKLNLEAKTLPEAKIELSKAQTELDAQDVKIKNLEAEAKQPDPEAQQRIEAEQKAKDDAIGKLQTAESRISTLEAEAKTNKDNTDRLTKELGDAKAKLGTFDEDVKKATNKAAIDLLASKGISPIQLGLTSDTPTPKNSGLTGRSRLAAAWAGVKP